MQAIGVEAINITKRFGAFTALDDVSLKVRAGTVHALLGENGAGKSTLVKCLLGYNLAEEGTFLVDGREAAIAQPQDAGRLGLGMVYQHFTLVPSMTVAENLVMARSRRAAHHRLDDGTPAARHLHGGDAVQDSARRAGRRPRRRRAAEGRNPQAALPAASPAGAGRADLDADAAGIGRGSRPRERPGPGRHDHGHHHHAQAEGGRGFRRRRERASARQDGRRRVRRRSQRERPDDPDDRGKSMRPRSSNGSARRSPNPASKCATSRPWAIMAVRA